MSKRKLSDQQQRRIRARQQQHTRADDLQKTTDDAQLGIEQEGLVIAHFGRQVDVEAIDGAFAGEIFRCHLRTNLAALVTGDRVVWRQQIGEDDTRRGVIVASHPRRSLLARPDSHSGQPKPVAANIDRLGIVIAPQPQPFANLIDRYLVAAENAGITPFLVLNKLDLLNASNRAEIDALLEEYRAIGYTIVAASARASHGLDALIDQLRGHTCAFVGQSGVGKSSLIGALLPGINIRIGALSEAEAKGRHTTTTARLFHLYREHLHGEHLDGEHLHGQQLEGSDLIDSPGIREFGLDHLDQAEVEHGFIELRDWLGRCRFRDCRHQQEPGCALHEAEVTGAISAARLRSFRAILAEAGG